MALLVLLKSNERLAFKDDVEIKKNDWLARPTVQIGNNPYNTFFEDEIVKMETNKDHENELISLID